jgi:hypothetical protein
MAATPSASAEPIDISFLQAIVNFAKTSSSRSNRPSGCTTFSPNLDYNIYGLLPASTVLTDSYSTADNAVLVGAFTPTGHAWESQNIASDTTPPATPAALVVQTVNITEPAVRRNLVVTKVTFRSASLSWKLSTGIGGLGGIPCSARHLAGSYVHPRRCNGATLHRPVSTSLHHLLLRS